MSKNIKQYIRSSVGTFRKKLVGRIDAPGICASNNIKVCTNILLNIVRKHQTIHPATCWISSKRVLSDVRTHVAEHCPKASNNHPAICWISSKRVLSDVRIDPWRLCLKQYKNMYEQQRETSNDTRSRVHRQKIRNLR